MEVPAPAAGIVEKLLVKVGDKVSEGRPHPACAGRRGRGAGAALPHRAAGADARRAAAAAAAAASAAKPTGPAAHADFSRMHASPSVRRLARELDVDLSALKGTGEKGRITREDVKAFLRAGGRAGLGPGAGGRRGHSGDPGRRLLEVRSDRDNAAAADQEDLRPASASRLAERATRHAPGRSGHHRHRALSQGARRGGEGEGLPGHAACLPDEGRRFRAEAVSRLQRFADARRRTR